MADYSYTLPYTVDEVTDYSVSSTTTPAPPDGYFYDWTRGIYVAIPQPEVINSTASRDYGISVIQPGDPIPYVFGHTTVQPRIICAHADGDYLYVDYLVAAGECEEFVTLIQNGEDIGLPEDYEFFLGGGAESPATSGLLTGLLGNYDELSGVCHFVAKLGKDDSLDFRVELKGLKLFDPRTSPQATTYSNNPALALARLFVDCGYTVNWDSVATVANLCDEDVSGASRWTVNMECNQRRNISAWVQTLAQYASCFVDIQGGEVTLIPDAPVTSSPIAVRNITSADIVEGSAKTTKIGVKDVPKQVIVNYRELDGTQRTASVGTGSTGEKSRFTLPGFQSFTMAKRWATQTLNKVQADLRFEFVTFDLGLALGVGDVLSITYAPHGLSGKLMRVVAPPQEVNRGRWKVITSEYDPALYDDSVYTAPSLSDTNLPTANKPPDGPTPTVVEELYTDQTATTYSRLKITFTGVSNYTYADGYKVTCDGEQNVLNAVIAHDGAVTHTVYTAALKQGVTYTAKVWVKSSIGALSEVWGEATAVAQGKLLPPGDVPYLTGYEAGSLVALSWTAAEEITGDLRGYIIKRLPQSDYTGTSADWTHTNAVTLAERVDATTYLTAQQPAGTYYFGVKAIDNTGTESENARWKSITVTTDAATISTTELGYGSGTNVHLYTIDGDAEYVITSTGETWSSRFGDTSPLATWGDTVTESPAERWGGDMATDSQFVSDIWALGSQKSGTWLFDTDGVTLFGGTQANVIQLGDNSSPISWTNHSGNTVNAAGYNFRAIVQTTDSPASAGDGFRIKLPVQATFGGKIVEQSGTAVIAATSPLDNPKAITFTTPYSGNPSVRLTVAGTTAKIAVVDNLDSTGFDLYLFDTSGNLVDGTVYWYASGT